MLHDVFHYSAVGEVLLWSVLLLSKYIEDSLWFLEGLFLLFDGHVKLLQIKKAKML